MLRKTTITDLIPQLLALLQRQGKKYDSLIQPLHHCLYLQQTTDDA